MKILQVENLSVDFMMDGRRLPAVSNLSFHLENREILALVGESGCGKSVTCLSLSKLVQCPPGIYSGGSILMNHGDDTVDVMKITDRKLREIRRKRIAYIFQEPSVSLNPVFRIGDQIAESVSLRGESTGDIRKEVIGLLDSVGIPEPELKIKAYPHELSGGMQQRVMIAMALAGKPDILVADEPTTALDVTIQAQILDLLREIREKRGMSIILVTHNLGIVSDMADRVVIMYAGHSVESGITADIINSPRHPYTLALLSAVPRLGRESDRLATISGTVPSPAKFPPGCRFYGRCPMAEKLPAEKQGLCAKTVPEWRELNKGHFCRCHYSK